MLNGLPGLEDSTAMMEAMFAAVTERTSQSPPALICTMRLSTTTITLTCD